jgi:colanic acid/amylovoran biosynthesis glycosyltransferase
MSANATVAHVIRGYLPATQTFVYTQLTGLRRHRPVVITDRARSRSEFPIASLVELTPPAHVAQRARRRLAARRRGWTTIFEHRLAEELMSHGCTLVHAHFGPTGWKSLAAARRLGLPLVTTFYGFDLALPTSHPAWVDRYAQLFAQGNLFLCEGPAMVETLASIGCPRNRIRPQRIGIDVGALAFVPPQRGGALTLLQAGRLVEKKGVDLSIRALARIRHEEPGTRLLVVGDGPERTNLERLARELDVQASVEFLGSLSFSEYQRVCRSAHVGLQPSRVARDGDTEGGAPTVLLEMQAIGLPVVATRHADIPFVVADPHDLVEEGDVPSLAAAILATSRLDEEAWQAKARRGREFVAARHDRPQVAASLSDHYDAVAGAGASRSSLPTVSTAVD